jgi:geranylgeranyl diphosphate synthase type I
LLLDTERTRWSAFDPDLAQPIDEIARLVLAGGKRLRPAFCHWGFVGAGGNPDDPRVIDAGAAFELMHAFALFHDDVMDGSTTRRGEPTTHIVMSQLHEKNSWVGESRRFGEGAAILVGDLAFVYADQLLLGAPQPVWSIWNELRVELNFGQYLDMLGSANSERRLVKAERICRYKSGKYTIERPLHLGTVLAAPEKAEQLLPALSAYGLPLGDGKPVGDDLREGKPTPLMAMATARANAAQLGVLQLVGNTVLNDDQVADVQAVIRETGALDQLEQLITSLTDEAIEAIGKAPLSQEARNELIELAAFVSWRSV